MHSVREVRTRLYQKGRIYDLTKEFLTLETWFKVTAHPLPKVTYSLRQIGPRRVELCSRQVISYEQTNQYRAPSSKAEITKIKSQNLFLNIFNKTLH